MPADSRRPRPARKAALADSSRKRPFPRGNEGARQHEPGQQVRAKASTFGLELEAAEAAGTMRLLHVPPHELDADCVARMIREDVEARGVRRLVIDSATELEAGLTPPERAPMFMAVQRYTEYDG